MNTRPAPRLKLCSPRCAIPDYYAADLEHRAVTITVVLTVTVTRPRAAGNVSAYPAGAKSSVSSVTGATAGGVLTAFPDGDVAGCFEPAGTAASGAVDRAHR